MTGYLWKPGQHIINGGVSSAIAYRRSTRPIKKKQPTEGLQSEQFRSLHDADDFSIRNSELKRDYWYCRHRPFGAWLQYPRRVAVVGAGSLHRVKDQGIYSVGLRGRFCWAERMRRAHLTWFSLHTLVKRLEIRSLLLPFNPIFPLRHSHNTSGR